jgi:hypothetical protein
VVAVVTIQDDAYHPPCNYPGEGRGRTNEQQGCGNEVNAVDCGQGGIIKGGEAIDLVSSMDVVMEADTTAV